METQNHSLSKKKKKALQNPFKEEQDLGGEALAQHVWDL